MTPTAKPLLEYWLELGRSVPWIELAVDPPFDRDSFVFCQTRGELIAYLLQEQYPLGRSFAWGDICFINLNSLPAADEWLAIKGRTAIGNIALHVRDELGDLDREASKGRIGSVVDLLAECSEEECAEPGFRERV